MVPQFKKFKIIEKKYIAKDILGLKIRSDSVPVFDFKPGQFVMLCIYDKKGKVWQSRAFSICSSPKNKEYLAFVIKIAGQFTSALDKLSEGDEVGVAGPYGFFTFDEKEMNKAVFLAGGVGVAPFISSIRYARDCNLDNSLTLIYSCKIREDVVFYKEFQEIEKQNKNFKAVFTLTKKSPKKWEYEKGRIDKKMLKKYCSFDNTYFCLCGPKGFTQAMDTCLKELGIKEKFIKTEKW